MSYSRSAQPLSSRKTRICIIFFDFGGGHRATAAALKSILEQQNRPWELSTVNLREILEPFDMLARITGFRTEDVYNNALRYGITLGSGLYLRVVRFLIRRIHAQAIAALHRYWAENPADLVVSVIPHFNREIFDGLRSADRALERPLTPYVTILTDLVDHPPCFWMEHQEQYLICGTEEACNQALGMGHIPERVFRTSGMIVRPEFYDRQPLDRADERRRLGLHPDLPTGLMLFGGYGSREMLTVAKAVAAAGLKTQFIFLCGHNQRLEQRFRALDLPFPYHVQGFTRDIPYFMRLADYFVGKPGTVSISEALVMGLPVILERNAWTIVWERFNTDWIVKNHLGVVLRSFAEIATGIRPMLDPQKFAVLRKNVSSFNNRAIFEIPDILERVLASHSAASERPSAA